MSVMVGWVVVGAAALGYFVGKWFGRIEEQTRVLRASNDDTPWQVGSTTFSVKVR